MKFLFDLLPVLAFFVGYASGHTLPEYGLHKPIEVATALAIVVSLGQIAWLKLCRRPVETMQWIALALIVVLGGATLLFHNPTFMYWKPTVLFSAMAAGLLISRHGFGKPPLKALLGKEMELPPDVWDRLMWAWVAFFSLLAVLNIVIAYRFSEQTWVNFKTFGDLGLTLVFVILQAIWLSRHLPKDEA
jgi:intracellular septation protein